MKSIKYISYFSISLVLQVVWLLLIKETSNLSLIDMITVSFYSLSLCSSWIKFSKKADKLGSVFYNPRASLSF